jgi:thiol-disulfide isomerase/thioredoxin
MIRAKPWTKESERDYDDLLHRLIHNKIKPLTAEKDDDFLVMAIGEPGCGKSMLMLHAFEEYAKEQANIDYVGFTEADFARAMNTIEIDDVPRGYRFVGNDEANISKRNALSKYNKQLLDLYFAVRGLNIFHWWNNPSIDMIDKPFVKERLKGVFLITTKSMTKPRMYYYFNQNGILRILDKYKNLEFKTIYKVRKKYAVFQGWFKDYKGHLKKPYLEKKNNRMNEKVQDFFKSYGKGLVLDNKEYLYTAKRVSELTKYNVQTIHKLAYDGVLKANVHFNLETPRKYNNEAIKEIINYQSNKSGIRVKDAEMLNQLKKIGAKVDL